MKLLKELLKEAERIEAMGGVTNYKLTTGSGNYYNIGITDGHFIKFYNEKRFYIDPEKIEGLISPAGPYKLESITAGLSAAENVKLTNDLRSIPVGKKAVNVRALDFNDGRRAWYNTRFEGYFDDGNRKFSNLEFRATTPKAPIYLLWNSDLVGVILPVIV